MPVADVARDGRAAAETCPADDPAWELWTCDAPGVMTTLSSGVGPVRRGETMKLYLAVPLVLLALLIAALGLVAVTGGWVLP